VKIYSMTATFGKLTHETLTLKPGLNIIEAPNEWGKSTWCAFILAMLYGIDTSSRSKKDFIADKERYAPWSGTPMSGRMDICWQGRNITIERSSKGRSIFGVFKAYETRTGVTVPELTAANCGQLLLGVEGSVFARAGFVRLKDMPVTQDESLRRRLNALVTTGDDSGAADDLAKKLRDLKNRCRFNRSGLLPQAETQQRELKQKLEEAEALRRQMAALEKRQEELKTYQSQLQNHKQTLLYEADKNFAGKLAMTRAQLEIADDRVEALESVCGSLPGPRELEMKKLQLQQLLEQKEALQMEIQLQPPAPQMPEVLPQFRGVDPAAAVQQAQEDTEEYARLLAKKRKSSALVWIIGLVLLAVGIVLAVIGLISGLIDLGSQLQAAFVAIAGVTVTITGIALEQSRKRKNKLLEESAQLIGRRYAPLERSRWVAEAQQYAQIQTAYEQEMEEYRSRFQEMELGLREILDQMEEMTGGMAPLRYEQETEAALQQHRAYADARKERSRLADMVAALESAHREVQLPDAPDALTFTMPETERILSDVAAEIRQLHVRAGQCQGRMDALGDPDGLKLQLDGVSRRIEELEKVYAAAVLAQQTLDAAKLELQRRFAPRISQRAQELFARLTGGRYQRFALDQELGVSVAAEGEDTLRGSLWRSDGTADQLYLALRLAVAEELTPQAPLVLDDAFVRFDDDRLKEILKILNQSGQEKQVLLFTCQSRERKLMEELS